MPKQQLTPMMRQYMQIKEENPNTILMYRLGDFYELFFDDAKIASRELNLVLTSKECGMPEKAPMCGVPHHAIESYLGQLVNKGYRVAICEQLEDPKKVKGLVKRGVTRLVTPGTVVEEGLLADADNSFLLSIEPEGERYGISWCDVSTGEFLFKDSVNHAELMNEISRLQPREILLPQTIWETARQEQGESSVLLTPIGDYAYRKASAKDALCSHFQRNSLAAFDIGEDLSAGARAAGALIRYLHESQKNSLSHITRLRAEKPDARMTLDAAAIRNLELVRTLLTGSRKGSLLGLLDKTRTPAGARMLKKSILEPLRSKPAIEQRLGAVERLKDDLQLTQTVRDSLDEVKDVERILSRLSYGTTSLKDLQSLKRALRVLPTLRSALIACDEPCLHLLSNQIDELPEIRDLLERAIMDENPEGGSGGMICPGYSKELDEVVALAEHGTEQLSAMEAEEREKTGIKSLKIRYNRVFGYYIEVSKSFMGQVPDRYVRRQTLAGGERYITEELKELEDALLNASEKRKDLENEIFQDVKKQVEEQIRTIQQTARTLSMVDVLQSLARVAYENGYVRPQITDENIIEIVGGRHPVVESTMPESFVPNDTLIGTEDTKMLLITGPNMAGKSTFMRQVGLITLMAHIGSFVPAQKAVISLVDRIFTRVGASDDLASGQSTFMVEMNELASILNNATSKSLLILDEVGRGTSTVDGLAIAKAAAEHILEKIGAKTLFATHYHELVSLADSHPQIRNCSVAVKEVGNDIVFLHRIVDGGTDRSFGIEVARLAGVPAEVIKEAKKNLAALQRSQRALEGLPEVTPEDEAEADTDNIGERLVGLLKDVTPDTLAPLEALSLVYKLKKEITQ